MRKKKNQIMGIIAVAMAVALTGCESEPETELEMVSVEELDKKGESGEEAEPSKDSIYVHVCGEVNVPGVYELEEGSRVYEAIEAAGGLTAKASKDALNQAEMLEDGQQIRAISIEELIQEKQSSGTASDGKININSASKEELMTLPGVGESKADAIIRYRNENGKFQSIEEIMEIEGIKEGVFEKIRNQITAS